MIDKNKPYFICSASVRGVLPNSNLSHGCMVINSFSSNTSHNEDFSPSNQVKEETLTPKYLGEPSDSKYRDSHETILRLLGHYGRQPQQCLMRALKHSGLLPRRWDD